MSFISEFPRKLVACAIIVCFIIAVAFIFWQQEMKYALPTPVPENYASILPGANISLPAHLDKKKSYFFHFYNPDCPCSRFNARHIKSLIGNYSDSIKFAIVVAEESSLSKAKSEFGDDIEYIYDKDLSIAKSCGVYSTPQAAIVSGDGKLFYRGNYNASRYCTVRASNFAELSLIALINNKPAPAFGLAATQSYGCELDNPDIEFF